MVSNKPGHRGEREVSRKTIARGMPGRSGVTVVTMLVCLFYLACEAAGASSARHSLRPLISGDRTFLANLARSLRRDREAVSGNGTPRQSIIHGIQVLTFVIPIVISTPPGTSGLLA